MPHLPVSSDVKIAYEVAGEGPPIVLVHGFASSRSMNWKTPGWYGTLTQAGRQVIALDVRGHRVDIPYRLIAQANIEYRF